MFITGHVIPCTLLWLRINYPRYQRFFLARDEELRRPRAKTRAATPREETSGAERLDLPCWMDLDLVINLSIKSAVASYNSKVITKGRMTRSSAKSHVIYRIT